MQQVEVVSIDRTLDPPSYGIRVDGNVRETEGHRLSAQRKLAAASVEMTGVVGTGGMVGDDAWGAFDGGFDFGEGAGSGVAAGFAEVPIAREVGAGPAEAVHGGASVGGAWDFEQNLQGAKEEGKTQVEEMTTAVAEVTETLIEELVEMGCVQ